MHLALYQPDMPPNLGTLCRLAACLGIPLHLIEPCGFPFSDRDFRRAALDYLAGTHLIRHSSWDRFTIDRPSVRLILLTTKAALVYTDFGFRPDDMLLVGRESAGVPEVVHRAADARLRVPMRPAFRSLNVAIAAAMVLGEALRQCRLFPATGFMLRDEGEEG
jgi:tRNA (cytidine/uridine-2'-O-)-methyltransferase